jgi:hypothetical protein
MAQFRGEKYLTANANWQLPPLLQIVLWELIETARQRLKQQGVEEMDYLQIFELSIVHEGDSRKPMQRIVHRMEEPSYRNELTIQIEPQASGKVFVIDEQTHAVMMMAEDY